MNEAIPFGYRVIYLLGSVMSASRWVAAPPDGSRDSVVAILRATSRDNYTLANRYGSIGFRCARETRQQSHFTVVCALTDVARWM